MEACAGTGSPKEKEAGYISMPQNHKDAGEALEISKTADGRGWLGWTENCITFCLRAVMVNRMRGWGGPT